MHKIILAITGLLSILALAACGGTAASGNEQPVTSAAAAGQLNANYTDALPVASQLILGSLRLDEGDQVISVEQAGQLLPLWQAYQSLSNSDNTAQAELDGLLAQIQQRMTPAQIEAIRALQLTTDDVGEALQALGPGLFRGGADARNSGDAGSSGGAANRGGGFPGGGPPGGSVPVDGLPGGFAAGEVNPEARATAMAGRLAQGGDQAASLLTRGMLNQLITALQLKTGAVTQDQLQAEQAQRAALRWTGVISDTTGIDAETLRQAVGEGSTLAEAITAGGGDIDVVKAALREVFKNNPNLDEAAIEAEIDQVLNTK
jgi:hypothetical protein